MGLSACSVSIPENYTQADTLPKIYPDYIDVTIPVNIAPLAFQLWCASRQAMWR